MWSLLLQSWSCNLMATYESHTGRIWTSQHLSQVTFSITPEVKPSSCKQLTCPHANPAFQNALARCHSGGVFLATSPFGRAKPCVRLRRSCCFPSSRDMAKPVCSFCLRSPSSQAFLLSPWHLQAAKQSLAVAF